MDENNLFNGNTEKQRLYEQLLAKWKGDITDTVKDWLWHVASIRIDLGLHVKK
jgi:hypothetical protein